MEIFVLEISVAKDFVRHNLQKHDGEYWLLEDGGIHHRGRPKVFSRAVFGAPQMRVSEISVVKPHLYHHKIL